MAPFGECLIGPNVRGMFAMQANERARAGEVGSIMAQLPTARRIFDLGYILDDLFAQL